MMKLIAGLILGGLAIAAVPAAAQTDFSSMDVKGTPRVTVTDLSGEETTGRLVVWIPSSIVVDAGGSKRTFTPTEAVRIEGRRDSLRNGIIIGAALGAVGGLMSDCPKPKGKYPCSVSRVILTLTGMTVWGAIGAGIDALIPGRTRLWTRGVP
jgi:hypothetical protein